MAATVQLVIFVWWVEPMSWRVEWKCAMRTFGGLYVMTCGIALMPVLLVDSWDS